MVLLVLVVVSGVVWLLDSLLIRRAEEKLERGELKLVAAAGIPVLEYVAQLAAVAFLIYLTFSVFFLILSLGSTVNISAVSRLLNWVHEHSERLESWKKHWDYLLLGFLILANVIVIYRQAWKKHNQRVTDFFQNEIERLKEERQAGKWEGLPPTDAMQEIAQKVVEASDTLNDPSVFSKFNASEQYQLREFIRLGQQKYETLDITRRIQPGPSTPNPKGTLTRLGSILMSRGVLTLFKGTNKGLVIASTAFTLLSTIYLATTDSLRLGLPPARTAIESVRLSRLHKESKDFLEQLDAKASDDAKQAITPSLSASQQAAINVIAKAYERAYAAHDVWNVQDDSAKGDYVRRQVVRESILSEGLKNATAPGARAESSIHNDTLTPEEKSEFDLFQSIDLREDPISVFGRKFKERLVRLATLRQDIRDELVSFAASFTEEVSPGDFRKALVTQIVSMSLDSSAKTPDVLGKIFHDAQSEVGGNVIANMDDVLEAAFFGDVTKTGSLNSARERMRHVPSGDLATTSSRKEASKWAESIMTADVSADLALHPARYATKPSNGVGIQRAEAELVEISTEMTGGRSLNHDEQSATSNALLDPIRGFDDYLPAQIGDETRTEAGRTEAKLAGDSGLDSAPSLRGNSRLAAHVAPDIFGSPSSEAVEPRIEPFLSSFERAGNFELLQGFTRIGGVLIGFDGPVDEDGKRPDFRDVEWFREGNQTRISLTRADHKVFSFTFRTSILQQALLYAADGRPIATTMTTALPLPDLKIQIHPALLDTPIGCRAVELDRLVDMFTDEGAVAKELDRVETQVLAQNDVYKFAYLTRKALVEHQQFDFVTMLSHRDTNYDQTDRKLKILKAGLPDSLQEVGDFRNPQQSLPAAKREFYDSTLVDIIAKCISSSSGPDFVTGCIEEAVGQQVKSASQDNQKTFHLWRLDPPNPQIWSGVREMPFTVDEDLLFLQHNGPKDRDLWPFDFLIQVAFDSNPAYLEGSSDSHARTNDLVPWTFPSVHETIKNAVRNGLTGNPDEREYASDMREFTLAQRLIRVLLGGQLGNEFPIEKLVTLTQNTSYVLPNESQTPRWTSQPIDAVRDLSESLAMAGMFATLRQQDQVAGKINRCLSPLLSLSPNEHAPNPAKFDIQKIEENWSCDLAAEWKVAQNQCSDATQDKNSRLRACVAATVYGQADTQSRLFGLRPALGIAIEDARVLDPGNTNREICRPIP